MNSDVASGDLLRAFRGFERAASQLQRRHATLRDEVEQLERQLFDAHRRLEAVVNAMDTGVAVLAADGEIVRANPALERLGVERSGIDGDIAALVRSGATTGGAARVRRHTPGGERELALTVVPVGDDEGSCVLTVQDVTEIRRQEEEGGRRQRLEALGRMAAEIAHEVRNPLGSIRLFAGLLTDELQGRDDLHEMSEHILEASASLEATVSNLLAFAAPSEAQRRRMDLHALAQDTCALLAPTCALRGVELEVANDETGCPVVADPEGMRQVLLNLLGNALAATERGGRIEVRTGRGGGHAVLTVEDSGRGIATEDLPRVFDPFFTRSEGGTGLGLSVVHGIVERHGGRISLNSRTDRGTRARVELPTEPTEATHG